MCSSLYKGGFVWSVSNPHASTKANFSEASIKPNMKFPVAILRVVFSIIFVEATTIARPGIDLRNTACTPGEYICAQKGYNIRCGNYPAIVRISTPSSPLLATDTNSMLQVICDALGRFYQTVACCGNEGCEVIDEAPHCM